MLTSTEDKILTVVLNWSTRWDTWMPNDVNAHPHTSQSKGLLLFITESLKTMILLKKSFKRGHSFDSDTDTEVLTHLIEEVQQQEKEFLRQFV